MFYTSSKFGSTVPSFHEKTRLYTQHKSLLLGWKMVTDQRTDGPSDWPMDTPLCRVALSQLLNFRAIFSITPSNLIFFFPFWMRPRISIWGHVRWLVLPSFGPSVQPYPVFLKCRKWAVFLWKSSRQSTNVNVLNLFNVLEVLYIGLFFKHIWNFTHFYRILDIFYDSLNI